MSLPPKGSPVSTRKHLLNVWKQTKKQPKQLLQLDEARAKAKPCHYLWTWYMELQGKDPLTYAEIESWSRLTHRKVAGFEAQVIRRLDNIYLNVINESGSHIAGNSN